MIVSSLLVATRSNRARRPGCLHGPVYLLCRETLRREVVDDRAPQSGSMTTRYLLPFQNRAASVTVSVLAFGPAAASV